MSMSRWMVLSLPILVLVAGPATADTRVCVEVAVRDLAEEETQESAGEVAEEGVEAEEAEPKPRWTGDNPARNDPVTEDEGVLPLGQNPILYLKRLIEHFVTHEKGYEAVKDNCDERITIELYPLLEGWTVFVRYSGNGREERVDRLYNRELSQFAERVALALLNDVPISNTINRENVLVSDSKEYEQRIKGTHHFIMGVGTQLRFGVFDTAKEPPPQNEVASSDPPNPPSSRDYREAGLEEKFRLFTPMTVSLGYRGKFEAWGVEALAHLGIGISKTASWKNPYGGHIDFGGDAGLQLHFLHYTNPRALTSFYVGGGGTFEMLWFSAIKASGGRSTLFSGGLNVDAVLGCEFMRASTAQFFLEGVFQVPVYTLQTGNDHASINTYFPAVSVRLGVLF